MRTLSLVRQEQEEYPGMTRISSALSHRGLSRWVWRPTRSLVTLSLCGFALVSQDAAAQALPSAPGTSSGMPNCAVTAARIGGLDVTEFFGLQGGTSSF